MVASSEKAHNIQAGGTPTCAVAVEACTHPSWLVLVLLIVAF